MSDWDSKNKQDDGVLRLFWFNKVLFHEGFKQRSKQILEKGHSQPKTK